MTKYKKRAQTVVTMVFCVKLLGITILCPPRQVVVRHDAIRKTRRRPRHVEQVKVYFYYDTLRRQPQNAAACARTRTQLNDTSTTGHRHFALNCCIPAHARARARTRRLTTGHRHCDKLSYGCASARTSAHVNDSSTTGH